MPKINEIAHLSTDTHTMTERISAVTDTSPGVSAYNLITKAGLPHNKDTESKVWTRLYRLEAQKQIKRQKLDGKWRFYPASYMFVEDLKAKAAAIQATSEIIVPAYACPYPSCTRTFSTTRSKNSHAIWHKRWATATPAHDPLKDRPLPPEATPDKPATVPGSVQPIAPVTDKLDNIPMDNESAENRSAMKSQLVQYRADITRYYWETMGNDSLRGFLEWRESDDNR